MTHIIYMSHIWVIWFIAMSQDGSWWIMMSHYESRRVIISHTYTYLLANHLISALTGFATWLRSKPWFEMMEIHKKWIENAKCYRNIYLSTYSPSPKIDTFCVCSKLQKCVNLWRVNLWPGNFWLYFPKKFWSKIDIIEFREHLDTDVFRRLSLCYV